MKGRMFKKIIASVSALSMLAGMAFAVPVGAANGSYLSTDFSTKPTNSNVTWGDYVTVSDNSNMNGSTISYTGPAAVIGGGGANEAEYTIASMNTAIGSTTQSIEASFKLAKRYNGTINTTTLSFNDANGNTVFGVRYLVLSASDWLRSARLVTNDSTSNIAVLPDYTDNAWTTYDVSVGYLSENSGYVTVNGVTLPFSGAAIKSISLKKTGDTQNRGFVVDDLKVDVNAATTNHLVTYVKPAMDEFQTEYKYEVVANGGHPKNPPEPERGGWDFAGWNDGTTTSKDLNDFTITKDTTLTAQYKRDASWIEPIKSVVISGPDTMTFGPDPDTPAGNNYTVTITGTNGTIITKDNLHKDVNDFKVEWDIAGFATENDQPGQYCDSYGSFAAHDDKDTNVTFNLCGIPWNFYGDMTAKVTYNNETYTAHKYVAALGDTAMESNAILPEAGYPSDIDEYPDAMVGYEITSDTYAAKTDSIVGGWVMSGSDDNKAAKIVSEGTNKYIAITAGTGSKSHVFTNSITSPATQAIFEQDMRFHNNGSVITLTSGYPFWSSSRYSCPVTFNYSGGTVTLNGTAVTNNEQPVTIETNKWYKVVLSVDKTNETCFTQIYDANGTFVGGTENVAWDAKDSVPTYYSIGLGNSNTGTVDFDNYKAYYPVADTSKYTLTASQETLSIPNKETADLVASLKTADGYDITGAATWTVLEEDMQEGVIITPDKNDSHKATVSLADDAVAGEATVQVNIGGYTKTVTLNITSSAESVKFTESSSSVSIPLDETPTTVKYSAIVVDGTGNDLNRNVSLAVYDKTNTNPLSAMPKGITFDPATGVLKVDNTADAATFTIRATGKNSEGGDISKGIKVTVHGLSFDFGAGTDADLAEGFTAVSPSTSYTAARGYGIASGVAAAGGTGSTANADSDYLAGNITFNAKVTKAKNYTVEVTYQGTLRTDYVNNDLSGYTLGSQKSLTKATFTVPVVDDVLDLILTDYTDGGTTYPAQIASLTVTKQADKARGEIPNIYHVGDSTAANNGSWAYYIDHNRGQFPKLQEKAVFYNRGAGGRNLCTYYTEGKLASVLRDIRPGDIVMFGNNGTNGMGSSFEADVNYYLDAAEAMGAKIIINSYTGHGPVGGYASNYKNGVFNTYRQDSYDNIVRAIAKEREANDKNYLGFVEIGIEADKSFNAYIADYANNSYSSKDAAAQAIIACFSDHNHYSNGSIARELMLNGYGDGVGIISQLVDILEASSNPLQDAVDAKEEINRPIDGDGEKITVPEGQPVKVGENGKITNATLVPETGDTVTVEITKDGTTTKVTGASIQFNGSGEIVASDGMRVKADKTDSNKYDLSVFRGTSVETDAITYVITKTTGDTTQTAKAIAKLGTTFSGSTDVVFGLLITDIDHTVNSDDLNVTIE